MLLDIAPIGVGVFFAIFAVLVILSIIYGVRAERERVAALAELAARIGFQFDPADDRSLPRRFEHFPTFRQGSDRTAYHTLHGSLPVNGRPVSFMMGDYRYTTESGTGKDRTTTTHHVSYLYARLPFASRATITVRRENFVDRIAGAIGFEDINFESAEFSRKFHVKSDDRKRTYDLFDPRMIEWYLGTEPPTLELIGSDMLLTDGIVWKPDQMAARLQWAQEFVEHWPTFVVQDLDSSAASG